VPHDEDITPLGSSSVDAGQRDAVDLHHLLSALIVGALADLEGAGADDEIPHPRREGR